MSGSVGGWASDVPISMPQAPIYIPEVGVGTGFVFTQGGLAHDISPEVAKQLSMPTHAPQNPKGVVYVDEKPLKKRGQQ